MYQQQVKLRQVSIISLGLAFLFGLISMIKLLPLFHYITIYLIIVSLASEGILFILTFKKAEGLRILSLIILLFIMISLLFIRYLKGS